MDECPFYESGSFNSCDGELIYYTSAGGNRAVRCAKHHDELRDRQQQINHDYPDSPFAPEWFDPADAGESWDDDY